jgi:hypothetical protein
MFGPGQAKPAIIPSTARMAQRLSERERKSA